MGAKGLRKLFREWFLAWDVMINLRKTNTACYSIYKLLDIKFKCIWGAGSKNGYSGPEGGWSSPSTLSLPTSKHQFSTSSQNISFNSLSENFVWNPRKTPHIQFSYFSSPLCLKVTGYREENIHSYTLMDRKVNL